MQTKGLLRLSHSLKCSNLDPEIKPPTALHSDPNAIPWSARIVIGVGIILRNIIPHAAIILAPTTFFQTAKGRLLWKLCGSPCRTLIDYSFPFIQPLW